MKLIIYTSDVVGVKSNCLYPHRIEVDGTETLMEAVRRDHVCAEYRDNYRGNETFIRSNCIVMDVDNDHSENPTEWITPENLADEYSGIRYAITYSRHHMKPKEGKGPRPRFHIYFEIATVTGAQAYSDMKTALQAMYPFYDDNALDAGRFIYGSDPGEVVWHDGEKTIESLMAGDGTEPVIPEGSRNRTMFRWAVRAMKRYGKTEDTLRKFYDEAEKCVPPLGDEELQRIWRSAEKYYEKIKAQPGYVSPEEYNGRGQPKWEEPIPFGGYTLAPFPTDALPPDIADYVVAVAESTQTPVDMAGTAALAAIAVCVQGKYRIRGKADWYEPLNGYYIVINPPSERKSAVEHAIVKPLDNYETQYNLRNAPMVEASKMRKRILERRQKGIEEQVSKGKDGAAEEMEQIAREIAEFEEVRPLQLYVDDITTEKLVSVMASNRGRAALVSSEGGIFDTLAGIYTRTVNIDVMLKGYSGDPIRVDRIGRESESVLNPTLTVLLMAQPSVVSQVMSNTTFRGRGLTARFLYSMPASFVGERNFQSAAVPDAVYARYEQKMINLLEDEYPRLPETITLSEEASELITAFAEDLEPKLVGEYADMVDWAGKLVGNILRMAGLLCRASVFRPHDFLDDAEPLMVNGETMAKAIRLGCYFLNHAKAVYNVLPDNAMYKDANLILTMIRDKGLKEFNRRMAMRSCRTFKTVKEIQPVLDFLEDYGYINQMPQVYSGTGRPPQPNYNVNPSALKMICPFVRGLSQNAVTGKELSKG